MKSIEDIDGNPRDVEEFVKGVNTDRELKQLYYYLGVAEMGRLLAATLPHEEIGRYPTEITVGNKTENSVELYRKHKDQLQELIDVVSKTLQIS